ncbi:putative aldo/keto reductase-like oxidoreductase [Hydrogenispora ethanolica]|uniref:Putative aldo/keto reductase-like oxidoreductase n=1 Tax=Hydrogenispora ethanolica TaxID=1082276 RepID=A0A4R1RB75_HYDET|nr:aldo/keto reductase [Hydrogenispora ethanolica]TCL63033.1 putative aldo/keto reductase-like oxidoreductase [Hydrogenispora ethanolica]
MEKIRLGRTGLTVSRSGFGAIPIQRISFGAAAHLLRKAFRNGINFFDTARAYTDSEAKIGEALGDVRKEIIIATKTPIGNGELIARNLETSLNLLKTDYIDIYQLHNPPALPDPEGDAYRALLDAKAQGMIRHIGFTNHRLDVALQAAASGLFDTVQFPLNSLSSAADLELIEECRKYDCGLIAMKGLSGGLITQAAATFAFLRQYDNVVPIWGIQHEWELDEFLALEENPPVLDEAMWSVIGRDRAELSGAFCRGCGYCLPCPAGIPIPMAARIAFFLKRSTYQTYLGDDWKAQMLRIEQCQDCGHCRNHCPYELDTPQLLRNQLREYLQFCEDHRTPSAGPA